MSGYMCTVSVALSDVNPEQSTEGFPDFSCFAFSCWLFDLSVCVITHRLHRQLACANDL